MKTLSWLLVGLCFVSHSAHSTKAFPYDPACARTRQVLKQFSDPKRLYVPSDERAALMRVYFEI